MSILTNTGEINDNEQLKRIADALEEILRIVKGSERSKKIYGVEKMINENGDMHCISDMIQRT